MFQVWEKPSKCEIRDYNFTIDTVQLFMEERTLQMKKFVTTL